jgi:hypothetical protein
VKFPPGHQYGREPLRSSSRSLGHRSRGLPDRRRRYGRHHECQGLILISPRSRIWVAAFGALGSPAHGQVEIADPKTVSTSQPCEIDRPAKTDLGKSACSRQ